MIALSILTPGEEDFESITVEVTAKEARRLLSEYPSVVTHALPFTCEFCENIAYEGNICGAKKKPWTCSRPVGHSGPHVACGHHLDDDPVGEAASHHNYLNWED